MTRKTKNLLMYAGLALAGYYVYTNYLATPSASPGAASGNTMAGLGWNRRRWRRRLGPPGNGTGGDTSGGASGGTGWGDSQNAEQYDPMGLEFENEAGYN